MVVVNLRHPQRLFPQPLRQFPLPPPPLRRRRPARSATMIIGQHVTSVLMDGTRMSASRAKRLRLVDAMILVAIPIVSCSSSLSEG